MTALPMTVMTDDEVAHFGTIHDAGFGALRTERGLLPLAAMDVDARVAGIIASIEVAQTFVNTTGTAIEATYIFPLPDRAAVHRFRMQIGERVIEGVVDERAAARATYDQAIATGHRAAITEEERPGVFTMRVGNLMPNESATVRLSLVGPLPVDDGEVTFRFPLVVAPRYMPGYDLGDEQAGLGIASDTSLVPDASRISPPVLLRGCPNPVRLGLRVAITDAAIGDLASSLHAEVSNDNDNDARLIEVQPGERLDRDFILRWRISGAELRSTLVCADDADGKGGSFLLTLVPPSTTTVAAKPRDVVFVIDRSGSMGGWKMVAARRAAARMIDTLTSRDRFSAMAFDNIVEMLPEPGLVAATDRNRYRAVEALGKVDARGGTELAEPLRRAVSMLAGGHDDRERVVVLVTDGQVGNEDQILRDLASSLRNVRMFSLGIDQAVNAAFLRRLASAGGGLCELVESEDRLDAVMAKVHRRIGTPIATELALRATDLEIEAATLAPRKLPDVYAGAPVTILGRYRGSAPANAALEIEGTSLGDPMKLRVGRTTDTADASRATPSWLAASWARASIRDLEDQYAAAASPQLKQSIVSTSKRFGVLSRFTAYLAVDRSAVVNPGGTLHQIVQPVEAPAGWGSAASAMPVQRASVMGMPLGGMRNMAQPTGAPPPPMQSRAMPARASMPAPMPGPMRPPADSARMPPAPAQSSAMPPAPPSFGAARGGGDANAPAMPGSTRSEGESGGPSRTREAKQDAGDAFGAAKPAPPVQASSPYLVKLATFARELEAQVHGRNDASTIRVLRQRLTEWIEDVRSVGGFDAIALEVERLVERLSTALLGGGDAGELLAVAVALAALATGRTALRAPKATRKFWK